MEDRQWMIKHKSRTESIMLNYYTPIKKGIDYNIKYIIK